MQIKLSGVVDIDNYEENRQHIIDSLATDKDVIVDLSAISFIDSAGLSCLVEGMQMALLKGQHFSLMNPSDSVQKILELSSLDKVFDISNEPIEVPEEELHRESREEQPEMINDIRIEPEVEMVDSNTKLSESQTPVSDWNDTPDNMDDLALNLQDELDDINLDDFQDIVALAEPQSSDLESNDPATQSDNVEPSPDSVKHVTADIENAFESQEINIKPTPVIAKKAVVTQVVTAPLESFFPVLDNAIEATSKADKNNLNKHSVPKVKLDLPKIEDYDDDPLNKVK